MTCDCKNFLPRGSGKTKTCFKNYWIFNNFNENQLQELKRIGLRKSIKKGAPVFLQGDPGEELFLIKTGRIKLSKVHGDGSEVTLDFRKAGDFIGENIFTGQDDYPLSAWAMEDTITCGFNINNFHELVLANPDIGLKVIQSMSTKMSAMTDRLESMAENSLETRLYSVLSNVAEEHGIKVENGVAIKFPLTHEDLGFLVGAHRVSITKAMGSLTHSGKIIKKGKELILSHSFS